MGKIRSISIAISLFIHTSVIGLMGGEGVLQKWIPVIPPPKTTEVALQFVDTPEHVTETESEDESRFISDKTIKAKDTDEETLEHPGETKTKEISPGSQLAKLSQGMPKPVSDIPKPAEHQESRKIPESPEPLEPLEESLKEEFPDSSTAQEAVQDTLGDDIVSLPEISEDIFSAPEEGPLTFETQYHKIGPYFKEIKQKIEGYWLSYLIFKYQNTAPIESETTVSFKILPTGEVTALSVVEYSGDVIFRDFCVATISNTAPYPPLPEGIREVEEEGGLEIVFTFRFK